MLRHLVGKHLISHYHYRRMQNNPTKSLHMILENIHSIVLQSPFQCRPCRFYQTLRRCSCNTGAHQRIRTLRKDSESFGVATVTSNVRITIKCDATCSASNIKKSYSPLTARCRSALAKPLSFDCNRCGDKFRYNAELRRHMLDCHPGKELCGTIRMNIKTVTNVQHAQTCFVRRSHCNDTRRTSTASINISARYVKWYSIRHVRRAGIEKTLVHRKCAAEAAKSLGASSDVEAMLHELAHHKSGADCMWLIKQSAAPRALAKTINSSKNQPNQKLSSYQSSNSLKEHRDVSHPLLSHVCLSCGESFALPQALGRHTRNCQPKASTSKAAAEIKKCGENSFSCDLCDFSAPFESELIFHRLHHTLGPLSKTQIIECPICSKEFRKYSLRCHLRQHTNEKNFICEVCDMKFARSHNLKDHMKSVHGVPVDEGMSVELTTSANPEPTTAKKPKKLSSELACSSCPKTFSSS
ncbi:unnamed protein product [Ceratitis capitata]|uniref:(Mediterranean fruit fly) hypothetical protein n=1 Tax=Ceratitis capitata TaxID=7213 RepID=A0A811US77_CERCA|nr:unnamed protein product [Ceratitis capitata]